MARHANEEWSLPEGTPNGDGTSRHSWDSIHAAILMDIRDELKKLNSVFACPNFRRIPWVLDEVARNTRRRYKCPICKGYSSSPASFAQHRRRCAERHHTQAP
jgi:hypothetical protein